MKGLERAGDAGMTFSKCWKRANLSQHSVCRGNFLQNESEIKSSQSNNAESTLPGDLDWTFRLKGKWQIQIYRREWKAGSSEYVGEYTSFLQETFDCLRQKWYLYIKGFMTCRSKIWISQRMAVTRFLHYMWIDMIVMQEKLISWGSILFSLEQPLKKIQTYSQKINKNRR